MMFKRLIICMTAFGLCVSSRPSRSDDGCYVATAGFACSDFGLGVYGSLNPVGCLGCTADMECVDWEDLAFRARFTEPEWSEMHVSAATGDPGYKAITIGETYNCFVTYSCMDTCVWKDGKRVCDKFGFIWFYIWRDILDYSPEGECIGN
jgi:hypothetical protein